MRRPLRAAAAAVIALSLALDARAAPTESEVATARHLFEEGLALEDAQRWGAALERFERVAVVKNTPQVRYNLGVCQENLGKLVEAWNLFSQVADAKGDGPELARLAALAEGHLAKLKGRIPSVVLRLAPTAPHVVVELDGAVVPAPLLGAAMLVNPGHHEIVVFAADAPPAPKDAPRTTASFETTGDAKPLAITLLSPAARAPPPVTASAPATPSAKRISPAVFVAASVGAAALSAALVVAILRASAISELDAACGPGRQSCPPDKRDVADRIGAFTAAANVLLGVGVAGLATAGVVLFVAPSRTQPTGVAWRLAF